VSNVHHSDPDPLIQSGIAKNGSLVFYLLVDKVSLEALDCLTDLENLESFMWNLFTHSFREYVKRAQKQHPDKSILCEVTLVVDLKGIPRSLFTERVMLLLKKVVAILNCFPEILSKAIVTNAPFFFSAIWLILKSVLDARTSAKIDIYSNEKKGLALVQKYIDENELIADKGGRGPSYQELLHQFKPKGSIRQLVERVCLNANGSSNFDFDLSIDEKALSMTVFTRSTTGTLLRCLKSVMKLLLFKKLALNRVSHTMMPMLSNPILKKLHQK